MIIQPDDMPELKSLENRIKRMYGMSAISLDQHLLGLELVNKLCKILTPLKDLTKEELKEIQQELENEIEVKRVTN